MNNRVMMYVCREVSCDKNVDDGNQKGINVSNMFPYNFVGDAKKKGFILLGRAEVDG